MALPATLSPRQRLSRREYFDALVRHQIALRRFGDTLARDLARLQRRRDITTVNRALEGGWRGVTALDVAERARRDADAVANAALDGLREFALSESVLQSSLAADTLDSVVPRATSVMRDTLSDLLPLGAAAAAVTLGQWLGDWRRRSVREMRNLMAAPDVRGRPASDVLGVLVGTPERNFKDGVREPGRRNIRTIVNTAINRASNDARLKATEGIADRVLWVSVLDARTSSICMTLDGRVYPIDNGPRPPQHPNCRSMVLPIPEGDDPDAWVPSGRPLSYEDWLQAQPESVQIDVLGRARAALFRRGQLPLNRFFDFRSNRRVTLAELYRQHTGAFQAVANDFDPSTRKRLGL